MTNDPRRDLELILLGLAMSEAEREKVLTAFPRGTWSKDMEPLLNAIRDKKPATLFEWLRARGCVLEKGKGVAQAIMDRLIESNEKERIRSVISKLEICSKLESCAELKERVKSILREIEGME